MNDLALARALHVLAVVLWIGGVGFVTTVLLPATRRFRAPQERLEFFATIERRFAWQARVTTLLAGLTGFYMVGRLDAWDRFRQIEFWWMHAMVAVWLIFTIVLFVAEPLFLDRWLRQRAAVSPDRTFRLVEMFHRLLLALSVITVFGAVAGSHGLDFP